MDDGQANGPMYEQLPCGDFFRVLKSRPDNWDDEIECDLTIRAFEGSRKEYDAISYVWGDSNETVNVTCDGKEVPMSISLQDALRNFRHPSHIRRLWADAICINQHDDAE